MALLTPSFACFSFVQVYFNYAKFFFTSIAKAYVRFPLFGLKRITPNGEEAQEVRKDPDLSHHLCRETRERKPNAIKNVWRMAQAKGPGKVITLANGTLFCPSSPCSA